VTSHPAFSQARADAKQAEHAAEEKVRGEQTSPPPTLAATAETERLAGWGSGEADVQANLEDQFEAEVACWRERQEREARETDGEAAEKVSCTLRSPARRAMHRVRMQPAPSTRAAQGGRGAPGASSHPHPHPHFDQHSKEAPEVAKLEAGAPRTESNAENDAEGDAEAGETEETELVRYSQQLDAMEKEPAGIEPRSLFSRFDAEGLEEFEARIAAMPAAEREAYMVARQRAELEWTLSNPALRRRNGELDWTLVELYARSTMPTARTVRASMRPHRTPPPSPHHRDVVVRTGQRSLRTTTPSNSSNVSRVDTLVRGSRSPSASPSSHPRPPEPLPSPHSPAVNGISHVDLETLFVRR